VVGRFVLYGSFYEIQDIFILSPLPERGLEVGFPLREEASPQMTIGRQAQPVAVLTEMMAHSPNKTDLAYGSIKGVSLRWAIQWIAVDRFEGNPLLDMAKDLPCGHESLSRPTTISLPHRHKLYKTNMVRLFPDEMCKVQDLIIIDAPHGYHIQLDGIEPDPFSFSNPIPDPLIVIAPCDLKESIWLEGVHAHVNAADTAVP